MEKLNLTLLERLLQMEAEQRRVSEAILELQRHMAITAKPEPPKTPSAGSIVTWSASGQNMRLPQIG